VYKASVGRRGIQQRFEESSGGHILISIFVVVTLLAVLTANLPVSRIQDLLLTAGHRFIYGTGLDQNWGVFSPDPRRETIHVTATVSFADGSQAKWQIHRRDPVLGSYVDYHWLKWAEFVVDPQFQQFLGRRFSVFVARRLATPSHRPVKVVLTNRWHALQPPGSHQPELLREQRFYTTPITEADLQGGKP
jgi:hypothetical protein